jgi:hypothetical protein
MESLRVRTDPKRSGEANMSLAIDGELCAKAHDGNPGNAVNPTANTLKDGGHH